MNSLWPTILYFCINPRETFNTCEPRDMYKNISSCIMYNGKNTATEIPRNSLNFHWQEMDEYILLKSHKGLFNCESEWITVGCNNINTSLKCNAEWKKASFRRLHTVWYHIYKAQTKQIELTHWLGIHIYLLKLFFRKEVSDYFWMQRSRRGTGKIDSFKSSGNFFVLKLIMGLVGDGSRLFFFLTLHTLPVFLYVKWYRKVIPYEIRYYWNHLDRQQR